jgi:hypothetical protein
LAVAGVFAAQASKIWVFLLIIFKIIVDIIINFNHCIFKIKKQFLIIIILLPAHFLIQLLKNNNEK